MCKTDDTTLKELVCTTCKKPKPFHEYHSNGQYMLKKTGEKGRYHRSSCRLCEANKTFKKSYPDGKRCTHCKKNFYKRGVFIEPKLSYFAGHCDHCIRHVLTIPKERYITKKCYTCGEEKPYDSFLKRGYYKNGDRNRQPNCKLCTISRELSTSPILRSSKAPRKVTLVTIKVKT